MKNIKIYSLTTTAINYLYMYIFIKIPITNKKEASNVFIFKDDIDKR